VGLFRRKKEQEGPNPGSGIESFEGGKVPWASERESVGRPVQGQSPAFDASQLTGAAGLSAVWGMMQQMQGIQSGITIDVTQGQQAIDASNTELGDRIKDVLRKYGIDPDTGATGSVDPNQMIAMQQEMMQVISEHQSGQAGG
jgi:hypothetical protein